MINIAYLEISDRMSGKTSRLHRMACALAVSGRPVKFVSCMHGSLSPLDGITLLAPNSPEVRDVRHVGSDTATWFFDEFDWYRLPVPVVQGAYYSSTLNPNEERHSSSVLKLIQANGGHYLSFERPYGEAITVPASVRLCIGEDMLQHLPYPARTRTT